MNGNLMYEIAKQRTADQQRAAGQQRAAREAGKARSRRAAAHGRHGAAGAVSTPAIPDFVHEMFGPRTEDARGRHARSGR